MSVHTNYYGIVFGDASVSDSNRCIKINRVLIEDIYTELSARKHISIFPKMPK